LFLTIGKMICQCYGQILVHINTMSKVKTGLK